MTQACRFTVRAVAGRSVLLSEVIECPDVTRAIEFARGRAAEMVPEVSIELWAQQAMLWSSRIAALLGVALLEAQ